MLRLITDAIAGYDELDLHCVLVRAVGNDPACFPLRALADLIRDKKETEFYVRFHASWLGRDAAQERARWGSPVILTPLCWHDDREAVPQLGEPIELALVVGPAFSELGDPPIPPRPR